MRTNYSWKICSILGLNFEYYKKKITIKNTIKEYYKIKIKICMGLVYIKLLCYHQIQIEF